MCYHVSEEELEASIPQPGQGQSQLCEGVPGEMASELSVERGQGSSQTTEGGKWTPDSQDSSV